jgi:hypothetical protein
MARRKVSAVNVLPDTFFTSRRAQIVALAQLSQFGEKTE